MRAQELKNSILQWAIQGRLVEQRPEEGTAKELIVQIKREKEQLLKDKKIKKEKPLPEIEEDEIPFDIPESWEWVRLNDIVSILGDGIHGTPEYDESGNYYFINGNNLNKGNIDIKDNTKKVNVEQYNKYKKDLGRNTILVSINGTIGNIAFYNDEKIILGKSACYFNLMLNEFKEYMYWLISTRYFVKYATTNATGSTIKNVSLKTMKNFIIPLPPLKEQKRIVAKIEELMSYVEQYDKAYTKLEVFNKKFPEDMQKSILQYAIQGKLVEQRAEEGTAEDLYQQIQEEKARLIKDGKIKKEKPLPEITADEIPFDIPENWKWVRLRDVSKNIHYGYTASAKEDGNCRLLRITDIQNNRVSWGDVPFCDVTDVEYAKYGLKNRDIMIARTGGTIGKSYIVDELAERAVFASYLIRVIPVDNINEKFLKMFMQTPLYWKQLISYSMGTGQPNVNGVSLSMLMLPLPPLDEQERILDRVEEMLPYCQHLIG